MVVGTFPIAKLGVLLVKQISKPVANVVKERAKTHPFFREYVCLPPAYFYNWCEIKSKMWALNMGKQNSNVKILSEPMAIELGANLLGEGIIFLLGAGLLLFEYNRQQKKETVKEEARKEEMEELTSTIRDLFFIVQAQQTQMRQLERSVGELESHAAKKPWGSSKKDPKDPPPSGPTITPELEKKIEKLSPTANPHYTDDEPEPKDEIESSLGPIQPRNPTSNMSLKDGGVISQSLHYLQSSVFKIDTESESLSGLGESSGLIINAMSVIKHDLKGLL